MAVAPDGSLYVADALNERVRRVAPDGTITTVAGTGSAGYSGDGIPATQARLYYPTGVALGPDGSLYIADTLNQRVRRVAPDGTISTVAGTGSAGYNGDGGPAAGAQLWDPQGVAVAPDGSLYIADTLNYRVRRIAQDGTIETVAGSGVFGYSGDGGAARQAQLATPQGVAVGPDGSLYIADTLNQRIRRVGPDGLISTVAGTGVACAADLCGDGGLATQARLWYPSGLAVGSDGSLYIADSGDSRVRRVFPDGTIGTAAGTVRGGSTTDGGPATAAQLGDELSVALEPDGTLVVADAVSQRVRHVAPPLPGVAVADVVIPSEDGSQLYVFDNTGRHLRTLDALTGTVLYTFGYDNAGHLAAVTDRDNNVTTVERDQNDNPTAIVSPYGQRTALTLDANGFLAGVTDPAGETVVLTSTAAGLLTDLQNPNGNVHHFSYDASGRLIQDQNPAGGVKTLARTDSTTGATNAYTVTVGSALDVTRTYTATYGTFDAVTGAQQRSSTSPAGLQTTTQLQPDGSSSTSYPDGSIISATLGPDPRFGMQASLPVSFTATTPGGLTSSLATTRTVTLTDSTNLLSLAALTDTSTLNGDTSTSVYDAAAKTLTATSPQGRTGTTVLNTAGRVAGVQVAGLAPLQFSYDDRGRLATMTQATRTYTYTYDAQGNLAGVADPLSRTVGFAYDAAGRVITQTLTDGRQIGLGYDKNGNVTSITPPGRPAHTFTYTAMNQVQSYTAPDAGQGPATTHYTYNLDGQPATISRPDGSTITYGYDGAGRLSTLTTPRGQTTYSYNPFTGNLESVTAPDGGTLTYGYDGNLLTDVTAAGAISGSVHQSYDDNFRVISQTVDGAYPVSYQYDGDGLLTAAGPLTLGNDPRNGLFTGSTLGPISDTVGYNGFGEVTSYGAFSGTAPLYQAQLTRDALGRIAGQSEMIGGATHAYTYTYDLAGRLTDVTQDGVLIAHYSYDANGNRLSYVSPSETITGTYDAQDRLLQYGTTVYTYTASGDLQSKTDTTHNQTTSYAYDALGNLTAVALPDGRQITYLIDGLNRRIGKEVNGVLTQGFLYGGNSLSPLAELDGNGTVVSRFVYAGGTVPAYMVKGGVTYRIISDHLGSPRLVVNAATGAVVQRLDYDAFGNVILDSNPGFQPFGFAGGLYDRDTGLVRFGARDYDAQTGRWTAKDPIGFGGGDTNFYAYARNDPLNWRDSNGLLSLGVVIVGIVGVLVDLLYIIDTAKDYVGISLSLLWGASSWAELAGPGAAVLGAFLVGCAIGEGIDAAGAAATGNPNWLGDFLHDNLPAPLLHPFQSGYGSLEQTGAQFDAAAEAVNEYQILQSVKNGTAPNLPSGLSMSAAPPQPWYKRAYHAVGGFFDWLGDQVGP